MANLRIKDIAEDANDLNQERIAIMDMRQRAANMCVAIQGEMDEIRQRLDSLPDDAPASERLRLYDQYDALSREYTESRKEVEECDRRAERLDEDANEIVEQAEDYIASVDGDLARAHQAAASSEYGRESIARLAGVLGNNRERARQVIMLLGGGVPSSGLGGFAPGSDGAQYFSDYQALVQEMAFGSAEGIEGEPSLTDRQRGVAFINSVYSKEIAGIAQAMLGVDNPAGVRLVGVLEEAYEATGANSLWDDRLQADEVRLYEEARPILPSLGELEWAVIDHDGFEDQVISITGMTERDNQDKVLKIHGYGSGNPSRAVGADERIGRIFDLASRRASFLGGLLADPSLPEERRSALQREIEHTRLFAAQAIEGIREETEAPQGSPRQPSAAPSDFAVPLPDSAYREALRAASSEEFERRIDPLPETRQGWQTLDNGNRVFNTPLETGERLNWHQGMAYSNIQGDCGLVCCENIALMAGKNVTEADVVGYARDNGLCTIGSTDSNDNGGTYATDRQIVLSRLGIESYLENDKSVSHVADLVESGRGVIASVNVGSFWNEYAYDDAGGHAVTLLSVERNRSGEPVAFYVCDSGIRDRARRVDIGTLFGSLLADRPLNVTNDAIR